LSRRISLPGADELFRPTREGPEEGVEQANGAAVRPRPAEQADGAPRRSSGRVKHDEKMTVYVTADELLDLEHARLTLRRQAGVAVDRGRLVREAIAIALADIDSRGADADIVRRLRQA
jgi:hypothetical protein